MQEEVERGRQISRAWIATGPQSHWRKQSTAGPRGEGPAAERTRPGRRGTNRCAYPKIHFHLVNARSFAVAMRAKFDASAASAGQVHACSAIQVDTVRTDSLAALAKDSRRAESLRARATRSMVRRKIANELTRGESFPVSIVARRRCDLSRCLGMEYAVGAMPIPAASAGAFHLRDRYFWVAAGNLGNADCTRLERYAGDGHPAQGRPIQDRSIASPSSKLGISNRKAVERLQWALGADKKVRPVGPGLRLLAHGIPDRIRRIQLHGFGNAIDTRPAAEFIAAAAEAINDCT
jgi:hypothetical protein